MSLRGRIERLKDDFKDWIGLRSPGARTTSLPTTRRPSPSPHPQTFPRGLTPQPNTAASPTQITTESSSISSSNGPLRSHDIVNTTSNGLLNTVSVSQPRVSAPPTPLGPSQTIRSSKETSIDRAKSTAWSGLKTLLKVVDASADVFPPLKSAVCGLDQCIDIFESASKGRKDYDELRTKLNALLEDLGGHLSRTKRLTMTTSMKNLSTGLDEELRRVQQKRQRGVVRRHVEAIDDSEEIMECYRRIQGHLERLTLNANLSIWEIIDEQATEARLHRLLPTMSAVYNSAESEDVKRGPCTPGTREREIARLLNWVHDKDGENVYWMNGMAGTGKTTIAYSLCIELDKAAELGASFFCSRLIPECRNVKLILPAIAYQLARFSRPFRYALSRVLEADPDVHTRILKTQFESLLVKPLIEAKETLPIDLLVVIDALDECENENSVGQILDILLAQTAGSNIPIRFLLSSRPEPEIYPRMMSQVGQNLKARLVLHHLDADTVKRDIETYLQAELKDIQLTSSQVAGIVERSGVLFIYASTAARYIKAGVRFQDYEERLSMILGLLPASSSSKDRDIDALYTSILRAAIQNKDIEEPSRERMKSILDTVICAQEPMTVDGLAGLLGLKSGNQVQALLRPLYSVLNIAEASGLVTTLHASFPDFMLSPDRSSIFHCDSKANHGRLAEKCFNLINKNNPQFNICDLRSSYLRDDEVTDLLKRADRAIRPELFYACRCWMAHLELSYPLTNSDELLYGFLSARLLFWMEVLNFKKTMHLGPGIIQNAESWSRTHGCLNRTIELAHDAWCFVTMFTSHAVSQSTAHLYVSMLAFWPETSSISQHYTKQMRGAIEAQGTAMSRRQLALLATWSFSDVPRSTCFSPDGSVIAFGAASSVYVIDGTTGRTVVGPLQHEDLVTSVAFSPNGALIASGAADTTIRVWNAQNGQTVVARLTGHTWGIDSVSFSPDSMRIVSGSHDKTIRVWDLHTGDTVIGPIKCGAYKDHTVCFSPDGTRIVSACSGFTLRVWDAHSGLVVIGPLRGHTNSVLCVCISPNSSCIASGGEDRTIRLWSAEDGQIVGEPLKGHSGYVLSVAFSPDGRYIVSGSSDNTIRLWDIENIPTSVRVLEGHTSSVTSVEFSSDGSRIISCSDDRTIRVWDARSRATVANSLEGHTKAVTSVGLSPGGKHIVSGSADKTIRMWDAQSGQMVVGPLEGHTDQVRSVCLSPDGAHIGSGSFDGTIRLWDVRSGRTVVGPLKGHKGFVCSICFSPDGSLIASGSWDNTVIVWNAGDGKVVVGPLIEHDSYIWSVCFSPDGTRVASGSKDRTIRVWGVHSGQTVIGPLKGHTDDILSVCFSADGTRIASGSRDLTVRVWDAQSGRTIFDPLEGHTSSVKSVCFSPDGTLIVSGSYDNTLRIWDAQRGQAVGNPLVGHTGPAYSVVFSSDGMHIVSGSDDQTIRVWDVRGLPSMQVATDFLPSHSLAPTRLSPRSCESWALREDGWVVDSQSRLLAWVPPDLHPCLLPPGDTLVISTRGSFKLNFDRANLGESWADRYQPPLC